MLDPHVAEWLDLAIRWLHVIAGIAWIGTSFYFVWLNNRVRPPAEAIDGVAGELWAVHGGGFYRVSKYDVAPERLPDTLHWFKWEAYTTWISGAALLVIVYYLDARAFLIDPARAELAPGWAVVIAVGTLLAGWLVYDGLCRTPLLGRPGWFAAVGLVAITLVAFALTRLFSPRGAYIHVGALIGTLMAGNVFRVIIPAQRLMVEALAAGEEPDPRQGRHAALRSLHNNYLTLPVVFVMISNHFPTTYGHPANWAILAGLFLVGGLTRHWFNLRGQGRRNGWILPAAAAGMLALALVSFPRRPEADPAPVAFEEGLAIIHDRCAPCHAAAPTQPGFSVPPKGIVLEEEDQIRALAHQIYQQAVVTETMPLGNLTGMTDAERETLGAWLRRYLLDP